MKSEIKLSDYDTLECPFCNEVYKPVKVRRNGTCVYEEHFCIGGVSHFEIDINGELID